MDRCEFCGFEYHLDRAPEAASNILDGSQAIARLLEGNGVALKVRPRPEIWSPLEYGCHVRDVLLVQRERILAARRSERPSFDPMGRDERVEHDGYIEQVPTDVARQLSDAALLFANVLRRLGRDDWERTVMYNYPRRMERSLKWVAVHTEHEVRHHLRDIDSQSAVTGYSSCLPLEHVAQIRRWHDRAYAEELEAQASERSFEYLGTRIVVPPRVMPITPMSHLLGEAVLMEVTQGERVLDMGTGSGVNAVLAAKKGAQVLAVDINPRALEAARANAARNGVGALVDVRHSDVFSDVQGTFDVIVFDPPFRWFKPRDWVEAAMADEGYAAMTKFFRLAREHLSPSGRMLIFFGTSGDLGYLETLMSDEGFTWETVAHDDLIREEGWKVDYFTFRVT